jgi:hypothetical protein
MSKIIPVKKDENTGEYYFDVTDVSDLFEDASIVDTYSLETRDDGTIILEFFDKDGNKVVPTKI